MPSDHAKRFIWYIIPVILAIVVMVFFLKGPKKTLQIPILADQVETISLYYNNEGHKKIIDTQEGIEFFLREMKCARIFSGYEPKHFPAGGQSFSIRFNLKDGTHYSCTYYQTGDIDGYYSDGVNHYRITSLNVFEVWERLSFPAIHARASEEFSDWPEL